MFISFGEIGAWGGKNFGGGGFDLPVQNLSDSFTNLILGSVSEIIFEIVPKTFFELFCFFSNNSDDKLDFLKGQKTWKNVKQNRKSTTPKAKTRAMHISSLVIPVKRLKISAGICSQWWAICNGRSKSLSSKQSE